MIHNSLYFLYDGESSQDYGVIQVTSGSGLQQQSFLANRQIEEIETPQNDTPFFQRIKREPLQFPLRLYFEDGFDVYKLNKLQRLFDVNYYKPMEFSEDLGKIYYCMPVDSSDLSHNCIDQGYVDLQFRCLDAFAYSPIYESINYDFTSNIISGLDIEIENEGVHNIHPVIEIKKVGDGTVRIVNTSFYTGECILTNLSDGEKVTINCEVEELETDLSSHFILDDHNDEFIELAYGLNRLKVYGDCYIKFYYQYKFSA
jgi:phage-related protein